MIISDAIRVAPKLYDSGISYEFVSAPGVGKTSMVYAAAAKLSVTLGVPFAVVTIILSQFESTDIRGFLFPLKGDQGDLLARFTKPSIFPEKWNVKVWVDGALIPHYDGPVPDHGFLFFDEFAQADLDVQKPVSQLLLEGGVGEYYLPKGWSRWAASNRKEDRSGVVKRAMFLQNRVCTINIEPSLKAWEDWAMRAGIHPLVISYAMRHPSPLFDGVVPQSEGPFLTPRSLCLLETALLSLRDKEHGDTHLPDDHIAVEVAEGLIGPGATPIFMTHIRLANDLPDIADVAKNPKTAKVPDRIDAKYIMAVTLPHHLTRKNGGAFVTYVGRLDKELQILFVTAAIRRGPEALNVPEMQQWVTQNKDLALVAFG